MDYYKAFPLYMGYQGYGQWAQPGSVPEDRIAEDLDYLRQMYPTYAKKYQGVISSVVDKMDYEGSFIYDQYPDKVTLQRMVASVMTIIKNNEEKENAALGGTGSRRERMPDMMPMSGINMPASGMPGDNTPIPGSNMPVPGMQGNGMPAPMPGSSMPAPMPGSSMPAPMPGSSMPAPMPGNGMPAPGMQGNGMPAPMPGTTMSTANMPNWDVTESNVTENTLTERAPWNEKEPWIRELVTVLMYYEILARRRRRQKTYWNV